MSRHRMRVASVLGALLVAAGATPGAAAERLESLWSVRADRGCSVSITHEQGSLAIERARGRIRLDAAPGRWRVEPAVDAEGGIRLSLKAAGAEAPDRAPVRLRVPSHCALEAKTEAGSISVSGRHRAPVAATSRTGDIEFRVEPRSDLDVSAATSGDLTVDFSVELDYRHHREPAKHGSLRVGSGGVDVTLTSRRGAVRVLKAGRAPRAS